ncbi:hypothetical protein ACFQ1I_40165 [Kitasatospora arboriphila]
MRSVTLQDLDGEALLACGDQQAVLRLWHVTSGALLNEAEVDRVPLAIAFGDTGLYTVGPDGATAL